MVNDNERLISKRINDSAPSLIRNRINNNLLKVKDQPSEVKSLLSLAVQTSKPEKYKHDYVGFNQINFDMIKQTGRTNRYDLLSTCIILATSRNTTAQENLIEVIGKHLGKLKDKDYKYIAEQICLKDSKTVAQVNDFLSYYLDGYAELHKKYIDKYYAF